MHSWVVAKIAESPVYVQEHLRQLNTFHDLSKRHWAYYEVMESANAHTAVLGKNETWSK